MRIAAVAVTAFSISLAVPATALELKPCRVAGVEARCGTLPVPEDRGAPGGRRIDLNIVVLPAKSKNPAPDPLFFFHGGPGGAATTLAPVFTELPFRERRDIVLVDQRGTGGSNPISCGPTALDDALSPMARFDLSAQLSCLETIDADPRLYTTREFVADIDAVREALGVERINIFGASYGTRAAFDYLAAYPTRSRSAILRGVAPTGFTIPRDIPRDSQAALDAWIADCERDRGCGEAHPNLKEKIAGIAGRLDAAPVVDDARDPANGERFDVTVDRALFAAAVHYSLYSAAGAARLPRMIDAAHRGDFSPLLDSLAKFVSSVSGTLSDGLFLSVACAEDLPFIGEEELRASGEGTLLGVEFGVQLKRVCERWPHAELPASVKRQRQTDVPLLLINGELDPVTPPHHTESVMPLLPNALHVVVPEASHGDLLPGCVRGLAVRFLEAGSVDGLDPACGRSLDRPAFVPE